MSKDKVQLLVKQKAPNRASKVTLVHAEFKAMVNTVMSTLKLTSGFRADQQKPKDLRHHLIPIYKYFAAHIPDIFGVGEEVLHDQLSDFQLLSYDVRRRIIVVSYLYHGDGKVVLHRLTLKHEAAPIEKDLLEDPKWDVV